MKSFSACRDNQIILKFPNGVSVSTVWGAATYSDNHDKLSEIINPEPMESETCEFWILEAPDDLLQKIYDEFNEYATGEKENPYGYVPLDVWVKVIDRLTNYTN